MIKYIDIIPTLIENTTTKARLNDDNTIKSYWITPIDGYKMHDKNYDMSVFDEEGNETGEVILGYREDTASIGADYMRDIKERELYTEIIVEGGNLNDIP